MTKIKSAFALMVLALTFTVVAPVGSTLAQVGGGSNGATPPPEEWCANHDPTFFKFPTWYRYLDAQGKLDPDCSMSNDFELTDIWLIVLAIIDMAIFLAAWIAIAMIIWGGFKFITSQGSPDAVSSAKNTILYAIIGLAVSVSANAIINFTMGTFL